MGKRGAGGSEAVHTGGLDHFFHEEGALCRVRAAPVADRGGSARVSGPTRHPNSPIGASLLTPAVPPDRPGVCPEYLRVPLHGVAS
jgi:hypothetical protein